MTAPAPDEGREGLVAAVLALHPLGAWTWFGDFDNSHRESGCTTCRTRGDCPTRMLAVLAAVGPDSTGGQGESVSQVWAMVYDSDTPFMDGTHPPLRMAEQTLAQAETNLRVVQARSHRAPKRNLRIETRFVSEWQPTPPSRPEDGS